MKRGLTLHQRSCKENERNREQSVTLKIDVLHDDQDIAVTDAVFKWDTSTEKTLLKE